MTKWKMMACAAAVVPLLLGTTPALAQEAPFEYAAKFVCGRTGHVIEAVPGDYRTVINVHSPLRSESIAWKVAVAGSDKAGPVSKFETVALGYDQALDIDCFAIAKRLSFSGITPPPFLYTGFVVIESRTPLDVVAVYTAAPTGGQVSSLHSERVPGRTRCGFDGDRC